MSGRVRATWTQEAYLALPETSLKIELFDGELVVSPPADAEHRYMSFRLTTALFPRAEAGHLRVLQDVGVSLGTRHVAIPDLAVIDAVPLDSRIVDAPSVRLIVEIVSRSNASNDRVRKMNCYATAGIPWYLLVERWPAFALRLFRLDGDAYKAHATVGRGEVLRLTEPFEMDIDADIFKDNLRG